MTTHPEQRADLEAKQREIAGHRYAETTLKSQREIWARFEDFCSRFAVPPLDCSEDVVLAFLAANGGLRASSTRALVTAIRQGLVSANVDPPQWSQVAMYLRAILRTAPAPTDPISTLSEDEVQRVAERASGPVAEPAVVALRGVLSLARVGAISRWEDVSATGAVAAPDGVLTYQSTPLAVVTGSLEHQLLTDGSGVPVGTCSLQAPALTARVVSASRRAGITVRTPAQVQVLPEEDFLTLLVHCDPTRNRQVRNLAWFTLGIHRGMRQISLANLLIQDVAAVQGGFRVVYRVAKLKVGATLVVDVLHVVANPDECGMDPLCPACALADQLEVCRRQGRSTGPVLATFYGGQWRVMTRQNARYVILGLFRAAVPEADPTRAIGTRTMRRTTATLMVRAGLSFDEIAAVLNHSNTSELPGYLGVTIEDEVHPTYDFG